MLWANSATNKLMIFFLFFSQKIGFDISSKLSPKETICMKCQSLRKQYAWNVKAFFLEKWEKYFKIFVVCWNFYPACKVLWVHIWQEANLATCLYIPWNQCHCGSYWRDRKHQAASTSYTSQLLCYQRNHKYQHLSEIKNSTYDLNTRAQLFKTNNTIS